MTLGNDNGTDGETDRRTDRVRRIMRPPPREEGRIINISMYLSTLFDGRPIVLSTSDVTQNSAPPPLAENTIWAPAT